VLLRGVNGSATPWCEWLCFRAWRGDGLSFPAPSQGKLLKKASAAELVFLKAFGISPSELSVDDGAAQEFRALFDSPLWEQHLRAITATVFRVDFGCWVNSWFFCFVISMIVEPNLFKVIWRKQIPSMLIICSTEFSFRYKKEAILPSMHQLMYTGDDAE
jgi:hypothetical protein